MQVPLRDGSMLESKRRQCSCMAAAAVSSNLHPGKISPNFFTLADADGMREFGRGCDGRPSVALKVGRIMMKCELV